MSFHRTPPARSEQEEKENYRLYKEALRVDFNKRCGYCDAHDSYSGGYRNYQIDHFAPRKRFPGLVNKYSNLVYSCFYCNNGKRDKWVGNDPDRPNDGVNGFLDPCDPAYGDHLARTQNGEIKPLTQVGQHIWKALNLGLRRHALMWLMDQLEETIDAIETAVENRKDALPIDEEQAGELLKLYKAYRRYLNLFREDL